jgi:hypothetical protein
MLRMNVKYNTKVKDAASAGNGFSSEQHLFKSE